MFRKFPFTIFLLIFSCLCMFMRKVREVISIKIYFTCLLVYSKILFISLLTRQVYSLLLDLWKSFKDLGCVSGCHFLLVPRLGRLTDIQEMWKPTLLAFWKYYIGLISQRFHHCNISTKYTINLVLQINVEGLSRSSLYL